MKTNQTKTTLLTFALASILLGGTVMASAPNAHAVPTTLWQIGAIEPAGTGTEISSEFEQDSSFELVWEYTVDPNNPINDSNVADSIDFPEAIAQSDIAATAAEEVQITFTSEVCYTEASLTFYKFGIDTNSIELNGEDQGDIPGAGEGVFSSNSLAIGPILLGENVISITADGPHLIDALVLEADSDDECRSETAWAEDEEESIEFTPIKKSWASYLPLTEVCGETVELIADGGSLITAVTVGDATITCGAGDGDDVDIDLELDDPWLLTGYHIHTAADAADIPQNKPGNPKVGQFEAKASFDGVSELEDIIVDGDTGFIAIHLGVINPEETN